jgi:hypothetical protein
VSKHLVNSDLKTVALIMTQSQPCNQFNPLCLNSMHSIHSNLLGLLNVCVIPLCFNCIGLSLIVFHYDAFDPFRYFTHNDCNCIISPASHWIPSPTNPLLHTHWSCSHEAFSLSHNSHVSVYVDIRRGTRPELDLGAGLRGTCTKGAGLSGEGGGA